MVVNHKPIPNKFAVGTNITFKCDPGCELYPDNKLVEYICRENGTWNSQILDPVCVKGKITFMSLQFLFK